MDIHILKKKLNGNQIISHTNLNIRKMMKSSAALIWGVSYKKFACFTTFFSYYNIMELNENGP